THNALADAQVPVHPPLRQDPLGRRGRGADPSWHRGVASAQGPAQRADPGRGQDAGPRRRRRQDHLQSLHLDRARARSRRGPA
ncbi:hypothetical protein OY671_010851, partial [Metschnikowia pulcherrima]